MASRDPKVGDRVVVTYWSDHATRPYEGVLARVVAVGWCDAMNAVQIDVEIEGTQERMNHVCERDEEIVIGASNDIGAVWRPNEGE